VKFQGMGPFKDPRGGGGTPRHYFFLLRVAREGRGSHHLRPSFRGDAMEVTDATLRAILSVVRKHVDQSTLDRIIEELLDLRGDKKFRDTVEFIARELRRDG
jgi:hypothetical protein